MGNLCPPPDHDDAEWGWHPNLSQFPSAMAGALAGQQSESLRVLKRLLRLQPELFDAMVETLMAGQRWKGAYLKLENEGNKCAFSVMFHYHHGCEATACVVARLRSMPPTVRCQQPVSALTGSAHV